MAVKRPTSYYNNDQAAGSGCESRKLKAASKSLAAVATVSGSQVASYSLYSALLWTRAHRVQFGMQLDAPRENSKHLLMAITCLSEPPPTSLRVKEIKCDTGVTVMTLLAPLANLFCIHTIHSHKPPVLTSHQRKNCWGMCHHRYLCVCVCVCVCESVKVWVCISGLLSDPQQALIHSPLLQVAFTMHILLTRL